LSRLALSVTAVGLSSLLLLLLLRPHWVDLCDAEAAAAAVCSWSVVHYGPSVDRINSLTHSVAYVDDDDYDDQRDLSSFFDSRLDLTTFSKSLS